MATINAVRYVFSGNGGALHADSESNVGLHYISICEIDKHAAVTVNTGTIVISTINGTESHMHDHEGKHITDIQHCHGSD